MTATVTLRLQADPSGAIKGITLVKAELGGLGPEATRTGARAAASFANADGAASRLARSVSKIRDEMLALAGAASAVMLVRSIVSTADSYSNLTAQLKLASESQREFIVAKAKTYEIAQRTSSALDTTAQLYARLSSAVRSLNGTQQDALALTAAINQSFAISGATAAESAGTIRQFSQALASGVLRGDEFNSIMEQSPRLVDAMTRSLGVTRGELRALAEDGQLTSKVVLESILKQKEAIERDYSQLPVTIGRSWQQLKNATTEFIGEADAASGASKKLAGSIEFVANNVDTLATAVTALSAVLLTRFAAQAVPAAIASTRAYVTNLAVATAATSTFGVGVAGAGTQLTGFAGAAANVVSRVGGIPVIVVGAIASIIALGRAGKERLEELQAKLEEVGETRRRLDAEAAQRTAQTRAANSDLILEDIRSLERSMARERGRPIYAAMAKDLERLREEYLKAAGANEKFNSTLIGQRGQIDDIIKSGKARLNQLTEESVKLKGGETALLRHRLAALSASSATAEQRAEIAKLLKALPEAENGLNAIRAANDAGAVSFRGSAGAIDEMTESLERWREEMRLRAGDILTDRTKADLLQLRIAYDDAIGQGRTADAEDFLRAIERLETGTSQYADTATQASDSVVASYDEQRFSLNEYQQIVTSGFGAMADAVGDFATGGIKSLSDFGKRTLDIAKRMVADLIAQFLRLRVIQPILSNLFGLGGGGASGGVLGSIGSIFGGGASGGSGGILGAVGSLFRGVGGLGSSLLGALGIGGGLAAIGGAAGALTGVGGAAAGLAAAGGGGAAAAASGAAGAAGAAGATGLAGIVPIIGWAVAIAGLVNSISGGKLFGTKYQTRNATSALDLGPGGGTASLSLYQERQAALFGGIRRRTQTQAATPEMIAAARELFDSISNVMIDSARQLQIDVPPMIDASLRTVQEYDKKGKLTATKHFVDVLGRSFEEATPELASTRLAAEAMLATIAASMAEAAPGAAPVMTPEQVADMVLGGMTGEDVTRAVDAAGRFTIRDGDGGARAGAGAAAAAAAAITNEVHQIAERWRSDANLLMQGAQFLLAAQTDVVRGYQLLGDTQTLTGVTDLIEDLQRGQEELAATYTRVKASAQLFDEALRLSSVNMDRTREELVRFAVDITEAAGGLDAARTLWTNYFEGFYSASERSASAANQLMEAFTAGIAELGLSADVNLATFRAAFEAGMPAMDAEQIAQWLTFAQTLVQVQNQRDALAAAEAQYAEWLHSLTLSVAGTPTAFQQSIMEIHGATAQYIADANALAVARGMEGASATDLALIHRWTTTQIRRAIAELERSTRELVNQLGYNGLTAIETQIAQLEQLSQSGSTAIGDSIANLFEQFRDGLKSLTEYADGLFVGSLSPYSLEQQLVESRRRLESLAAAARMGDMSALGQLQGASDQFLGLSQRFNASGSDYGTDFDFVQSLLRSITNPYGAGGGIQPVELVPSAALLALYQERDRITAEQEAARRLELANQLAEQLQQVAALRNETVFGAADRMQVNFAQFIADLGANAAASTAAQVAELGNVANALNVELPDLAEHLRLSLGSLTDMNSLLNDAFEAQLATLPAGLREQLEPALRSLETAASTEESVAALDLLTSLTAAMPEQFRLQLAPYLSAIDPIDASTFTDLNYLSTLDVTSRQSRDILQSILDELRTQPAEVYQADTKAAARAESEEATQVAILAELRALRQDNERLQKQVSHLEAAVVAAVKDNTAKRPGDMRGLGEALRGNARSSR